MTDALNLAGVKLGNYRLHRVLGQGSMGVVYLATDEALQRPTAVKLLTWSAAEHDAEAWFLAEARNVAKLNHPSVVQIYSVARHGPYRYIAMEYVEGTSAEAMVTRLGAFSAERATEVILQVAAALELAHASGIIHRDVKPGNILIKGDGTAKLGDFGMAVTSVRTPQTAVRAGTPHYLAPELWRGERATIATDLYALGATYYYLLTGRPPIEGSTIASLGAAHQHQVVAAPPELAAHVAGACMRVVQRCMEKSPSERYDSARTVAWEARGVLRELESPWLAPVDQAPGPAAEIVPRALRTSDPEWRARGFQFEPFGELDPSNPPYCGAPFDGLGRDLLAKLGTGGTTVVVAGAPGAGRSVLVRAILSGNPGRGAYIDLDHAETRPGRLVQRIARAVGAGASSATAGNPELEGLLEFLAGAAPAHGVPLIVVDGVRSSTRAAAEVAILARAARSTRYFNLLVVGPGELGREMPASAVFTVPPLTLLQCTQYLESWLEATRAPDATLLILTMDAALLVGSCAEGNLARLNALARQMIMGGGSILTSWDAWAADRPGRPASEPSVTPARPERWPTREVLRRINQCRIAAGLAERGSPEP